MEFINETINALSPWFKNVWVQMALLVFVATFHGYGAAWLAVRMLFRPRRPFKVFGITIFPQGMIPRHRERLAAAIGKAVGEELVSQETIMDELLGKDFLRRKISGVVNSYTEEILSQDYPSIIESLPAGLREPVLDSISTLQFKIAEHIETTLKSEQALDTITTFVEKRVDEALSKRVSDVVDDDSFEKMIGFLEERVRTVLRSKVLEQKVRDFVNRRVEDLANSETPLGEMFTPDAVKLLKEKASEQIEPMTHHLTEIAAAEKTRNQIGALIKKEVHAYYEGLPFFKKIFVSRENLIDEVDDLVNDSLPKRIEETLKGDFFADEARNFIDSSIENALSRPLPELVGTIEQDQLDRLKEQVSSSVITLLQGDAMMTQVSAYLTDTLSQFRPHSIDSILRTVHPDSEENIKSMLSKGLLKAISRPDTSRAINEMLSNQIDTLLSRPLGKLSDIVSEDKIRSAGESVSDAIIAAIREKLPDAIKEFDVGNVVREKITNYPAEKLEALVMSVAKEHLRTIELFGAAMGLLIGLGQAAIHYYSK